MGSDHSTLSFLMENLNEKQLEAANHKDGPILIVAGAGSGKTRTLTSRVVKLIEGGVKPENILAITFTNKAAKEMRNRILGRQITSNRPEMDIWRAFIGTFHSFGASILKKECGFVERTPAFTIFDEDDSSGLFKEVMKEPRPPPERSSFTILIHPVFGVKASF